MIFRTLVIAIAIIFTPYLNVSADIDEDIIVESDNFETEDMNFALVINDDVETDMEVETNSELISEAETETNNDNLLEIEKVDIDSSVIDDASHIFTFENDEIIVKAFVVSDVGNTVEMKVSKLESGSQEYELTKDLVSDSFETNNNEYIFYDVMFLNGDGEEIDTDRVKIVMHVEFKNINVDSSGGQSIFSISKNGVKNITDKHEKGTNLCSVNFLFSN